MRNACACFFLLVALIYGFPFTILAQDEVPANPLASQAQQTFEAGDTVEAWKTLVRMDQQDPSAWENHRDLLKDVISSLNEEMKTLYNERKYEDVVELAEAFGRPESAALFQKRYPDFTDQYRTTIADYLGNSYYSLAQVEANRGNSQGAMDRYRLALQHLKPGDLNFSRANANLAQLLYDAGGRKIEQADKDGGVQLWTEAARLFVTARDNAGPTDMEIARNSHRMLEALAGTTLLPDVPGMPTPTPPPTRTPEGAEAFFAAGWGKEVKDFFSGFFGENTDLQGMLLLWGGALIGFVLLYWVIPIYFLGFFERGGDILAAQWKHRVKYIGFIAVFGYFFSRMSMGTAKKKSKKKHGCPHCGEALDNMFAYEDLVFSRCPKCQNKIVPLYTLESYIEFLASSMGSDAEKVNTGAISLESFVKVDAVARLVRALVTLAVRRRASDLHVEPDEHGLIIRQRIDGIMTEMFQLPRSLSLAVVSAIKVQANMNIAEKRIPQDGKFQMHIDKTDIDVRVATSPTSVGEKATLRVLDIRSIQMGTKHLGMNPKEQQIFERAIHQPHGMVLITGPTGSGKTTTIYVAIQQLTTGDKNIISIEDPIEFRIPGVNQTQINPTAGLTFASGLRSILRQDPDVIVVGEIRDPDTAEISVNAVQTGHLVFSTLHTVDASSSVARLIDFKVSPRQFADALSLIVAQRLIRLVCQYCKKPYRPSEDELEQLGLIEKTEGYDFQKGTGCKTCNETGYYRRTGIFEMLQPSERMRVELENSSLSTGQIRELAIQGGMLTLRAGALQLLKEGRTTTEETIRVTK